VAAGGREREGERGAALWQLVAERERERERERGCVVAAGGQRERERDGTASLRCPIRVPERFSLIRGRAGGVAMSAGGHLPHTGPGLPIPQRRFPLRGPPPAHRPGPRTAAAAATGASAHPNTLCPRCLL
jgi:hypothetical protein